MTAVVVAGGLLVALVAWVFLFTRDRGSIWPRTWLVAAVLIAYAVGGLAVVGELGDALGSFDAVDVLVGAAVGTAWLVATHIGHAVLCRLFPSFVEQIADLYQRGRDDPPSRVVGPVLAMALAEELLFRGLVHSQWGLVAGVVAYTAVQVVERKWALVLAALLGGAIWGGLYEWTGGLVAPVVAHAIWTTTLTLVWRLPDCGTERLSGPAGAARA